jgi:hypothetical protein
VVRAQEQHFTEMIVRREREMSAEFRARVEEKEREFAVVATQREESKRVRVCEWRNRKYQCQHEEPMPIRIAI